MAHEQARTATRLEPAEKMLKAAIRAWNQEEKAPNQPRARRAFVTVSRQPGAGGNSFSHRLAERLNQGLSGDWSAWDRELVEKVAAEHGIAEEILEAMPSERHNWLDEMLQGLLGNSVQPEIVEVRAYKKIVMVVRALAAAGHAVIVGRGGAFITEGMPGAIHLRLVAPLEHRIKHTAQRINAPLHEAAELIARNEEKRNEFYRRYWPGRTVGPETFTLTLNTAELGMDEMLECVLPMIRSRDGAAENGAGARRQFKAVGGAS